jgi:hypothetical protein
VISTFQGKLVALHFGHASHSFISPCPRPFNFPVSPYLLHALLYTEKQEINKCNKRSSLRYTINHQQKVSKQNIHYIAKIKMFLCCDLQILSSENISFYQVHGQTLKSTCTSKLFLCII